MAGGPDTQRFADDRHEASPQERLTGRLRKPQDEQRKQKSERNPKSRETSSEIRHDGVLRQ